LIKEERQELEEEREFKGSKGWAKRLLAKHLKELKQIAGVEVEINRLDI